MAIAAALGVSHKPPVRKRPVYPTQAIENDATRCRERKSPDSRISADRVVSCRALGEGRLPEPLTRAMSANLTGVLRNPDHWELCAFRRRALTVRATIAAAYALVNRPASWAQ